MTKPTKNLYWDLSPEEKRGRIRIRVVPTAEECKTALPGVATKCMYALALRRAFPTAERVSVDVNGATVTDAGRYWRYRMPKKGGHALLDFDEGKLTPGQKLGVTLTLAEVEAVNVVAKTRERKDQINKARNARRAAGKPDKVYNPSLRLRITHSKKPKLPDMFAKPDQKS